MSRSAAGVDYRPFQVFQKLVLSRSRELYYIGGSDVLPAPLEPKREAYVISRLKTDQEQEARSLLHCHFLRTDRFQEAVPPETSAHPERHA